MNMRLDKFLVENNYFTSRNKASEAIENKQVLVNGKIAKASLDVNENSIIKLIEKDFTFVSQGGYKLNNALTNFNITVKDKVFADIGASTGGFTDCLLQYGARQVYCVDVGENLLDKSLIENEKVCVMDKTNAKTLTKQSFTNKLDGVVIDCSFISLKSILPVISNLIDENGLIIALIKPQFEMKEKLHFKNGIIKDKSIHFSVCEEIFKFANDYSLYANDVVNAPIKNGKNREFLVLFEKNKKQINIINKLKSCIDS